MKKEKEKKEKKEERSLTAWVKAHKKELIITGIGITGVVITLVVLKKKRAVKIASELKDLAEGIPNETPDIMTKSTVTASSAMLMSETTNVNVQVQTSNATSKQLNHVFKAQKQGWDKEYDGIWFNSNYYTKEQAASEIKPFQALTQRGYPYTGYEFDGQKYYKYTYLGLFESDKMPGDSGVIDDIAM